MGLLYLCKIFQHHCYILILRRGTELFSHACMPFEALFREKFDICEQIWRGTFRMGLGIEKFSAAIVDANEVYISHYAFLMYWAIFISNAFNVNCQ